MGTQAIPELKPNPPDPIIDTPRVGPAMWSLLAGFLIPPALITLFGSLIGGIPNQKMWILLLGAPIPIMLLSLPRTYRLDTEGLTISGLFYRLRVKRAQVLSVRRVGMGRALVHPGSVFCSDPGRALLIERAGKFPLVISPRNPAPFLALGQAEMESPADPEDGGSGDPNQV